MMVSCFFRPVIDIDIATQYLFLKRVDGTSTSYRISTAKNSVGESEGSGCTPRGLHAISQKIGSDLPKHSVFIGRAPTGEIYNHALAVAYPQRDWILSRILWLTGLEAGKNLGLNANFQCVDTQQRYIYIHGTPDTEVMGVPRSHGCIRMRNDDVIALFDQVEVGTVVNVYESMSHKV